LFGAVAQRAIRVASRDILDYVLKMDLGFHNQRQTGGLIRVIILV
jgi:ABC-type transport system involved in Fe-S cluster assembly fused permease/ATPase subunit